MVASKVADYYALSPDDHGEQADADLPRPERRLHIFAEADPLLQRQIRRISDHFDAAGCWRGNRRDL